MSDHTRRLTALFAAWAAIFLLALPASAQDGGEEPDERETVKQIKKDLDTLVEDLAKIATGGAAEKGDRVVDNIDKLLKNMGGSGGSGDRVVDNIDELLKQMKMQQSQSGGGGGQGQQKPKPGEGQQRPSQRRDRNQKGEQGQDGPKDGQQQQKKPDGEGDQPTAGDDTRDPKQGKNPRKPPGSREERVPFLDDREVWGTLPPEVKQILIESSYREYYPEYERDISEYLKSLNRRR